jgi:hypothetical protein
MTTDANGNGSIMINPAVVSGITTMRCTNGTGTTWATGSIPSFSVASTDYTDYTINATQSALAATTVQARLVSVGIQLFSRTSNYDEQGQISFLAETNHQNMQGMTWGIMQSHKDVIFDSVRKKGGKNGEPDFHFFMKPSNSADPNYSTSNYPWNNVTNGVLGYILVQGAKTTAPVSFMVRLTIVVEYTGPSVEAVSTPNPIPAVGVYEHVLEVAHKVHKHKVINPGKTGLQLAKFGMDVLHQVRGTKGGPLEKSIGSFMAAVL